MITTLCINKGFPRAGLTLALSHWFNETLSHKRILTFTFLYGLWQTLGFSKLQSCLFRHILHIYTVRLLVYICQGYFCSLYVCFTLVRFWGGILGDIPGRTELSQSQTCFKRDRVAGQAHSRRSHGNYGAGGLGNRTFLSLAGHCAVFTQLGIGKYNFLATAIKINLVEESETNCS